jgi:hypothetical protein
MPGAMYVAQTTEMFRRNAAGQGLIDELELPATVFPAAGTWNQFQSMTKVEQEALASQHSRFSSSRIHHQVPLVCCILSQNTPPLRGFEQRRR